jgi:hypothetical protein
MDQGEGPGSWTFSVSHTNAAFSLHNNNCILGIISNLAVGVQVGDTQADTLTIKATKLTEGHKYLFRVVAENEMGVSDPCTTDEPITAKLPFGTQPSN